MKVTITTEFIRLDALLKFAGFCSTGGEAKRDIEMGFARVNGNICTKRGKKLRHGDKVHFKNEDVEID